MWRVVAIALFACQPQQPLQPSYFSAKRPENAPLDCRETLDCYARCQPLVEECMLLCDRRATSPEVEKARAVNHCGARNGCAADRACEEQHCAAELEACTVPRYAPPPSPMRPPPPMQPPPMQPQPVGPPPPMQPPPPM
jgi:hypothetical protein